MKKTILLFLTPLFFLTGCSSGKGMEALKNQGYTNIQNTGTAFFGCAEDDNALMSFHFQAKDEKKIVSGTICCAFLFKGCTIRY